MKMTDAEERQLAKWEREFDALTEEQKEEWRQTGKVDHTDDDGGHESRVCARCGTTENAPGPVVFGKHSPDSPVLDALGVDTDDSVYLCDGCEAMGEEQLGLLGGDDPDDDLVTDGGEPQPATHDGEIVVAQFRAKSVDGTPSGRDEYDPGEKWATCSTCGYGGIIDGDPKAVNADHPQTEDRLVCAECANRYDRADDVAPRHRFREALERGGEPFPTDRLREFGEWAVEAVDGGNCLAHGEAWLLLDLPDENDGVPDHPVDHPVFPREVLDEAHDRGLRVSAVLWRYGAVEFQDPAIEVKR